MAGETPTMPNRVVITKIWLPHEPDECWSVEWEWRDGSGRPTGMGIRHFQLNDDALAFDRIFEAWEKQRRMTMRAFDELLRAAERK